MAEATPIANLQLDSVSTRIGRGVVWSLIGSAASAGSNFLLGLTLARVLGREGFGGYGLVQGTAVALAGMAQLATGYTATRYVAETRDKDPLRTGRIIGLCSVTSLATAVMAALMNLVFADKMALWLLKAPDLAMDLRLATGLVFFGTLTGQHMGVLAGFERYSTLTGLTGVTSIITFFLAGIGGWTWGLSGASVGLSLGMFVQWLMFRTEAANVCRQAGVVVDYFGARRESGIIMRFALPAAVSGLSSMPAFWAATAILARQSGGVAEVGRFTAALGIRAAVQYAPQLLNKVSMSVINNHIGNGDSASCRRAFATNLRWTAISIVVAAAAVLAAGPYLFVAFGREFVGGMPVLIPLVASVSCDALMQAPYQIVQSRERMWLSFCAIILPRDVLLVACAAWLCPSFGAVGLAWAYAVASFYGLASTSAAAFVLGLESTPGEMA